MLSVVIPTFDRLSNLKLCLAALGHQANFPEFEIVIADDGSTDGTMEWLFKEFPAQPPNRSTSRHRSFVWAEDVTLTYLYCGPNQGFRAARSRNIAASNCCGDHLVFLDSDIALNQYALKNYQEAHGQHPRAIVVGFYHWLPPFDWGKYPDKIHLLWDSPTYNHLVKVAEEQGVKYVDDYENAITGEDVRMKDFAEVVEIKHGYGMSAWTGNISYPRDLFFALGGFDERIVGHGGEDADLGLTADEYGVDWTLCKSIFGFHLYHDRDDPKNQRETQANLTYLTAKHGTEGHKRIDKTDWSDVANYHSHYGAVAVQEGGSKIVYSVRGKRGIGVSSMAWLRKLGFDGRNTVVVQQGWVEKNIHIMGFTQ